MAEDEAIGILSSGRIMAISTVRPDGWPQTTIVGYANDGLAIYFLIFRASQKYGNILADPRVSVAVGNESADIHRTQAVFAGAIATEVVDPAEKDMAWRLLAQRHPNLWGSSFPDDPLTALIRADCKHLSVLDYRKGLGHTDAWHVVGEEEPKP